MLYYVLYLNMINEAVILKIDPVTKPILFVQIIYYKRLNDTFNFQQIITINIHLFLMFYD